MEFLSLGGFPDGEWEKLDFTTRFLFPLEHHDDAGFDECLMFPLHTLLNPDSEQSDYTSNGCSSSSCNNVFLRTPSPETYYYDHSHSSNPDLLTNVTAFSDTVHGNQQAIAISSGKRQSDSDKQPQVEKGKKKQKLESGNENESSSNSSKGDNGKTRAMDPQSLYARKRRENINKRLRILQELVPNGTKVDISTMLEEAVQYVKFLQLQIKVLSSDEMWMYAPIAFNVSTLL